MAKKEYEWEIDKPVFWPFIWRCAVLAALIAAGLAIIDAGLLYYGEWKCRRFQDCPYIERCGCGER